MLRIFILLLFLVYSSIAQTTIVKGKLLDANNQPSKFALVGIIEEGTQNGKNFVNCDDNGNYKIILTQKGVCNLLFSLPGHNAVTIPVINNENKSFTIDVTLAPYKYLEHFDNVKIAGTFNNFNIRQPEEMTKQKDGTYIYKFKTDKKIIKYQICNITQNYRTINGPNSTLFEPDSSGDYVSVIKVDTGTATIIFNPKDLVKSNKEQIVSISNKLEKEIFNEKIKYEEKWSDALAQFRRFKKEKKDGEKFHYDSGKYLSNLQKKINSKSKGLAKDYLKLIYLSFASLNPKDYNSLSASKYFNQLTPDNFVWQLLPQAFSARYYLIPKDRVEKVEKQFLKESSGTLLKMDILISQLYKAKYKKDTEKYKKVRNLLANKFGKFETVQQVLKMLPDKIKIIVGAEIPDFEVTSLDNPNEKFSKKNMLGKIYLIDFWATWCSPCVDEMKFLHDAYKKFKNKGFEILSFSSDMNAKTVAKFRSKKWEMPWKHSLLKGAQSSKIRSDFEVYGIPKPILVGADGKILAMQGDLRGENLEKTLSKYFK